MNQGIHIVVSGVVQGVGYRAWTQRTARELGLVGWVRNLEDGRVEIYAAGDPDAVLDLSLLCHEGPRGAMVRQVMSRLAPVEPELMGFEIVRTVPAPPTLPGPD